MTGFGDQEHKQLIKCDQCKGTGKRKVRIGHGDFGPRYGYKRCSACDGTGKKYSDAS